MSLSILEFLNNLFLSCLNKASCLIIGSASQYLIAKARGNKDGPLNYLLAGFFAGSVYGLKCKLTLLKI